MERNIGTTLHYMDKIIMKLIITTTITPKMDYAETVWSPHTKKNTKLERIQKRTATNIVSGTEGIIT